MESKIKLIMTENQTALSLKNEPFKLSGRMVVSRLMDEWCYTINYLPPTQASQQTFPAENYSLAEINAHGFALGAFVDGQAVGLGVFTEQIFKYLYLDDLKVAAAFRRHGLARKVLQQACQVAKERGYAGLFTIGQHNNLAACLFYLDFGFKIGGLNTKVYEHTAQAGKDNIYFYYDF